MMQMFIPLVNAEFPRGIHPSYRYPLDCPTPNLRLFDSGPSRVLTFERIRSLEMSEVVKEKRTYSRCSYIVEDARGKLIPMWQVMEILGENYSKCRALMKSKERIIVSRRNHPGDCINDLPPILYIQKVR